YGIVDLAEVGNLNEARALQQTGALRVGIEADAFAQPIGERLGYPAHRDRTELSPVEELQASVSDPAKAVRFLQDRIEHGREIARRRIDDLQHLGSRGLPRERLARLLQEPRVLDGNDRLGSEVLHERDLLIGERPHLLAVHTESAEQSVVPAQCDAEQRARAAQIDKGTSRAVAGMILLRRAHVRDVNKILTARDAHETGRSRHRHRLVKKLGEGRWYGVSGSHAEVLTIANPQGAESRLAQPRRLGEHRLEDRSEIARRTVDDLQYLGRGSLPLERLARLGQEPRILHRD